MLAHILDPIVAKQPSEVIFVIGFLGDQIAQWVGKEYKFKSTFVLQDQLLGLGYALHLAMAHVSDEPLLIVLGDTIIDCDLGEFLTAGSNVLGLRSVPDPQRFGIAQIENGKIVGLEEKPEQPKSDQAIVGLYYFSSAAGIKSTLAAHVASGKKTRGEIQFTDALQGMISSGTVFTPFQVHDWFDCGKFETMLATNRHLLERRPPVLQPGLINSVVIPPSFVGPDCAISDSVIGPYASIGAGSAINSSHVKNSIIGERAKLESVIIDESILGPDTAIRGASGRWNLGAGSVIEQS